VELARTNQVRLIGREELIELILQMNPQAVPHPKKVMEERPPQNYGTCPRCRGKLVLRKGPRGQFLGCESFPRCRYTKNVAH
jgi:restriction system protein